MNLGTRLNRVLASLLLHQEGGAMDYSRDRIDRGSGGHGAHGDPSRPPAGNSSPLVQQWAERFERLIERAESDAGIRPAPLGISRNDVRPALRKRMHEYEGIDSVDVAFYERCSERMVREVRKDMGRSMNTGERLQRHERPMTAPARESLQMLQDSIGGEL